MTAWVRSAAFGDPGCRGERTANQDDRARSNSPAPRSGSRDDRGYSDLLAEFLGVGRRSPYVKLRRYHLGGAGIESSGHASARKVAKGRTRSSKKRSRPASSLHAT